MKSRTAATLVILTAALATSSARAEAKFAYCDMRRALNEVEESKIAQARLKKQFDDKQKRLNDRQEELKREGAQLENQAREGMLKDDKLREKQAGLQMKVMELSRYLQDSQKELQDEDARVTGEILAKMQGVTRAIAEAEGFAFVFDRQGLVFAPDSLDITNEVIRKYNARFGKGTAGAASAGGDVKKNASAAAKDARKKDAPKK